MAKSIAKKLGETFGGKWTYDGMATWWCDDDRRTVSRVSAGVDEFDNEIGPAQYWLYGDGSPKRLSFAGDSYKAWGIFVGIR